MKYIFLNLKRFDVPAEYGGVNRLCPVCDWGGNIVSETQEKLTAFADGQTEFVHFLPEAHLLRAVAARKENSPVEIGSQGVSRTDITPGGNFGAITAGRPAAAVRAMGCGWVLVGHCEERRDLQEVLTAGGATEANAVDRLLNREIHCALNRGLKVLYCIGESSEQQPRWEEVLGAQLAVGLDGVDLSQVVIGYEPIWSIGPGKTPADKPYITKIARFVKEKTGGMAVVYGGGLKTDNAEMLASIEEIDGGLIALTRFQGEIGFYPNEYMEIVGKYLGRKI